MNKIFTEARCKIIWGESPSSVREFLSESKIPLEQADGVIESLLNKRYDTVRKNGIIKLIKTIALLIILGALLYFQLINADKLSAYQIRKFSGLALALTGVGLLWNLWKGTDALMEIMNPTKFKGDVGTNSD